MGSFIGAALPWVGGKMCDLLGLQGEAGNGGGASSSPRRLVDESQGNGRPDSDSTSSTGPDTDDASISARDGSIHISGGPSAAALSIVVPEVGAADRRRGSSEFGPTLSGSQSPTSKPSKLMNNGQTGNWGSAGGIRVNGAGPVRRVRNRGSRELSPRTMAQVEQAIQGASAAFGRPSHVVVPASGESIGESARSFPSPRDALLVHGLPPEGLGRQNSIHRGGASATGTGTGTGTGTADVRSTYSSGPSHSSPSRPDTEGHPVMSNGDGSDSIAREDLGTEHGSTKKRRANGSPPEASSRNLVPPSLRRMHDDVTDCRIDSDAGRGAPTNGVEALPPVQRAAFMGASAGSSRSNLPRRTQYSDDVRPVAVDGETRLSYPVAQRSGMNGSVENELLRDSDRTNGLSSAAKGKSTDRSRVLLCRRDAPTTRRQVQGDTVADSSRASDGLTSRFGERDGVPLRREGDFGEGRGTASSQGVIRQEPVQQGSRGELDLSATRGTLCAGNNEGAGGGGTVRPGGQESFKQKPWCWRAHDPLPAVDESECCPHRNTQLRVGETAQRVQTQRMLPLYVPEPTVSNWPALPPSPSPSPTPTPTRTSPPPLEPPLPPIEPPQENFCGGSGGRFSVGGGSRADASAHLSGVGSVSGVSGRGAPTVSWGAGAAGSGREAPVYSNGVLVPRPSLWGIPQGNGGMASEGASAPVESGRRLRSSMMRDRAMMTSTLRSAPAPAPPHSSVSTRQPSDAYRPSTASIRPRMPPAPGRLAWTSEQRLLHRPTASLQPRRHPGMTSGIPPLALSSSGCNGRSHPPAYGAPGRDATLRGSSSWGGPRSMPDIRDGDRWKASCAGRNAGNTSGVDAEEWESRTGDSVAGGSKGGNAGNYPDYGRTLSSSGLSVTSGDDSDVEEEVFLARQREQRQEDGGGPGSSSTTGCDASSGDGQGRWGTERDRSCDTALPPDPDGGRLERPSVSSAGAEPIVSTAGRDSTPPPTPLRGAGFHSHSHPPCRSESVARSIEFKGSKNIGATKRSKKTKETAGKSKRPRTGLKHLRRNEQGCDNCEGGESDRLVFADSDGGRSSEWDKAAPAQTRPRARAQKQPRQKGKARSSSKEPDIPPPPPGGPRKWPPRPPSRALVYAAAAETSRRARGFTGWMFPALPPPPPPPPKPPTPPRAPRPSEKSAGSNDSSCGGKAGTSGEGSDTKGTGKPAGDAEGGKDGVNSKDNGRENGFLGLAKDNPPGMPSPNEFGWLPLNGLLTAEGREAARKRAMEKIAQRKRQEILDALRIKEELAEARRKRKLSILFLGMTRVAAYDCVGGLAKGRKRFDIIERMVRQDVDETNMNPLRDTARVLAMEALGHEVRCVSKVATPGEGDSERCRSTRAKGGPIGLGRFLATDMTNTGASRGFLKRVEEKWENTIFDTVMLDHYWLPDSVVWLNKGYMANDGGLIQNLVRMTYTSLLRDDFEIMLPINQAFFELLLPHFNDLEAHFTVEFLVGERLEHLKKSHLALEADELIPAEVMLNIYGKQREHQVSQMLGVKQPTPEVATVLLKYGVAAQHFCYARFLKLTRNPNASSPFPTLSSSGEVSKKSDKRTESGSSGPKKCDTKKADVKKVENKKAETRKPEMKKVETRKAEASAASGPRKAEGASTTSKRSESKKSEMSTVASKKAEPKPKKVEASTVMSKKAEPKKAESVAVASRKAEPKKAEDVAVASKKAEPKKGEVTAVASKKAEPKKAETAAVASKKAEATSSAARRAEPKKAEPKKAEAKKAESKRSDDPTGSRSCGTVGSRQGEDVSCKGSSSISNG